MITLVKAVVLKLISAGVQKELSRLLVNFLIVLTIVMRRFGRGPSSVYGPKCRIIIEV